MPSGDPSTVPYGFEQPAYQPLGVQHDFILASLARIEAEMTTIIRNQELILASLAQIPKFFVPDPCPPHDFPKVWVYRKGDTTPTTRHCQKCGQAEEGPPPW